MESRLKEIVGQILKKEDLDFISMDQVGPEDGFEKMGVNSLIFIKVVVALEKEFGFSFELEKLNIKEFKNLKELADYVELKRAEALNH